ncbi:hypothetical protein R50345_22760 [Paenibacillus sp. FSL R5-0345]|uniref:hypothetical protein n=1 Tax=Paenibacillus sp. FSL R5-0345 TaxID=1536770 RepID=UPI0004F77A6A|nr:hypothetical protein [Paenibacillus sp. FSL R5-0345]AIQ37209.1 hypothetical protein R50345_22760 [Paenibacillus sp. FSL R5-0345]
MIDLTNGVDISAHGIETAVSVVPPKFINLQDKAVELAPDFPNMMYTLWGFICANRRFPSQTEYTLHFLSIHASVLSSLDESAIKARLLRAFPSLIREIHFYALVKESGFFQEVNYSAKLDVEDGTDLSVRCGGYEYGVSCYVQTERSLEYRRRKRSRPRNPKANSIELPLDLSSGNTVNGWIFYNRNHVHVLLDHIIEYASKNYNQGFLDVMGV